MAALTLRVVEEIRLAASFLYFSVLNAWQPSLREKACSGTSAPYTWENSNITVMCAEKGLVTKLLSWHTVQDMKGLHSHVPGVQRGLPLDSPYSIIRVNIQVRGCILANTASRDLIIKLTLTLTWEAVFNNVACYHYLNCNSCHFLGNKKMVSTYASCCWIALSLLDVYPMNKEKERPGMFSSPQVSL